MGRLFDTRQLGDILLLTGKGAAGKELFPEKDFYDVLRASWEKKRKKNGTDASPNADWQQSLALGGVFTQGKAQTSPKVKNKSFFFSAPANGSKKPAGFMFIAYPRSGFSTAIWLTVLSCRRLPIRLP